MGVWDEAFVKSVARDGAMDAEFGVVVLGRGEDLKLFVECFKLSLFDYSAN